MNPPAAVDALQALSQTRAWLERVVIGLNLCPFARSVHARQLLRWVCSDAHDLPALQATLADEMRLLRDTPATQIETTLLLHPWVLNDFGDYNQFLDEADGLLEALGLEGVLQVASFHPHYQFAGTSGDDIGNATNRSPYPMLHLLRESSVDRALAAFPEAGRIYEVNLRTLQALGARGLAQLQARCLHDALAGGGPGD